MTPDYRCFLCEGKILKNAHFPAVAWFLPRREIRLQSLFPCLHNALGRTFIGRPVPFHPVCVVFCSSTEHRLQLWLHRLLSKGGDAFFIVRFMHTSLHTPLPRSYGFFLSVRTNTKEESKWKELRMVNCLPFRFIRFTFADRQP